MFRRKALLLGICVVLLLGLIGGGAAVLAKNGDEAILGEDYENGDVVGYVIHGYEIQPLILGKGCEMIATGASLAEFIDSHPMSPEEETTIVHDEPPCPVVINGTLYKPGQIHLFDGQRLGFTTYDGTLYAFTSAKEMEGFLQEQEKAPSGEKTYYAESIWYEDWYYGGQNQLKTSATGIGISDLGDIGMDNMISSQIIKTDSGGCTLFDTTGYGGDYFYTDAGEEIPILAWHGFNDKASSLIVYSP